MYSKDQLMHMKRKILLRIADYFDIKGISKFRKEELVDRILSILPKSETDNENVPMSVRIRRINNPEDNNE